MRIALGIEYDGSAYNGWQRVASGTGIQQRVEEALSGVADESIEVVCAGRTDSGVHAAAQVVHFDSRAERSERSWLLGANSNLPDDINVSWVRLVDDGFHARYSALSRTYRYLILNRLVRSALHRQRAWWVHQPLDTEAMQRGVACLIGKHDFSAFRAAGCQARTAVREVMAADVIRDGDWVSLTITANAFLQHMVRNVVGLLVAIGKGERQSSWAASVLQGRDRKQGGVAAPAHGLMLIAVQYPADYELPACATPTYRDADSIFGYDDEL